MVLSWLRSRRQARRPDSFRPLLEPLGERIVPANAHFISATSSVNGDGALVVNFKEAGLGNNQNIDYALTGDMTVNSVAVNNGGNVVQGTPWTVNDTVLASATFNSGKNGNVTASLTVEPPSPGELGIKQAKGNGWVQTLTVSYTDLVLTDQTNNVSIGVPDQGPVVI
jgi:hypothetical protein